MNLRIGIHGPARAGKDTIAKHLVEHHGFIKNSFADPLKRAGQQMFMLTEEQTWSDELKEQVIKWWGMSPRQMFQKLGTEGGRNVFGEDLWLKRWQIHFDTFGPVVNYVTPDARFENEATFLRERGFTIIHVSSPRVSPLVGDTRKHASENGIVFREDLGDIRVVNNTFPQLYRDIDTIVAHLEMRR